MTESEVLIATDEKIVELGTTGAKRLIAGKTEEKNISLGKRLLLLKKAYNNTELEPKEKEALFYCLINVSGKFAVAALLNSGGLGIIIGTGFEILLEDDSGFIQLEDGSGNIELEIGP